MDYCSDSTESSIDPDQPVTGIGMLLNLTSYWHTESWWLLFRLYF